MSRRHVRSDWAARRTVCAARPRRDSAATGGAEAIASVMVDGCYSTPRLPVTIVTFNAGLLRAFGGLLQPAPFVAERRAAIPPALAAAGGDIVVLQEVYGDANRRLLSTA